MTCSLLLCQLPPVLRHPNVAKYALFAWILEGRKGLKIVLLKGLLRPNADTRLVRPGRRCARSEVDKRTVCEHAMSAPSINQVIRRRKAPAALPVPATAHHATAPYRPARERKRDLPGHQFARWMRSLTSRATDPC
jgi:hypothetical protein